MLSPLNSLIYGGVVMVLSHLSVARNMAYRQIYAGTSPTSARLADQENRLSGAGIGAASKDAVAIFWQPNFDEDGIHKCCLEGGF